MDMTSKYKVLLSILAALQQIFAGQVPQIPSGHRTQYYVLKHDGGYKYGYDTGSGYFAKQIGDSSNQVEGHYGYRDPSGNNIDLRYSAGVQGFVPSGLGHLPAPGVGVPHVHSYRPTSYAKSFDHTQGVPNADGSYSFSYTTNDQSRHESADSSGNVQGNYWYINNAGKHDLSYVAGEATGFQPTGGSLSIPPGVAGTAGIPSGRHVVHHVPSGVEDGYEDTTDAAANTRDASYSFSIDTNEYQREESSDSQGNVQGRYSYQNKDGNHDLTYTAGSKTGFVATGGSLATPNGVGGLSPGYVSHTSVPVPIPSQQIGSADASYSFIIDTDDYKRQESSDASGNVQGSYSYTNKAGTHDLSYKAGAEQGFVATGGSLATPNGLGQIQPDFTKVHGPHHVPHGPHGPQLAHQDPHVYCAPASHGSPPRDGSYSFTIDTNEYKRKESSDTTGNVQGSYSYSNKAGTHDLSYKAGSDTGFVATGGSLSVPNGLAGGGGVKALEMPHSGHLTSKIEDGVLKTYLPPKNEKNKFGYIFESRLQH